MYDTIRNHLGLSKIQVLPNNDFIVMGGHSLRDSANFFPSFLFKFNANGDSLWRKIYYVADKFGDRNLLADNVLNADGSITACGWVDGDTLVPYEQIWLLKTDSMGNAPGPQNVGIIDLPYLYVGYGELKVFPNPAKEFLTAEYSINKPAKEVLLLITDMQGRLLIKQQLTTKTNQALVDIRNLKSGSYHCTLMLDGKQKAVAKVIIKH